VTQLGAQEVRAVGTSALRDARGGQAFVRQATAALGCQAEIISGAREARLTFVGALSGLPKRGRTFVFDIGGGSTELIVGQAAAPGLAPHIDQGTSLNIGSVRLTERHSLADPPTEQQLSALREDVRAALLTSSVNVPPETNVVGVAGTVTTLVAIAESMVDYDPAIAHGYTLPREIVSQLTRQLCSMTVEQRRELPGLTPGRADVIAAGAILCEEIMLFAGAEVLTASDRGVRFGLLAEMMTPRKS
jgi:exopolyphosphatase/guanosine-5'-triphosphate,3'-diphosphate pyrophosphatase